MIGSAARARAAGSAIDNISNPRPSLRNVDLKLPKRRAAGSDAEDSVPVDCLESGLSPRSVVTAAFGPGAAPRVGAAVFLGGGDESETVLERNEEYDLKRAAVGLAEVGQEWNLATEVAA